MCGSYLSKRYRKNLMNDEKFGFVMRLEEIKEDNWILPRERLRGSQERSDDWIHMLGTIGERQEAH